MQQRDTERLARDTRSSALRGRIPRAALAGVLLTLGLAVAPGPAASQILVLDFEGLEDLEPVGDFYDGGVGGFGSGPGPDFDIVFSPNALAIIDADAGGTGNFGGEPSPDTVLFFEEGAAATMNVAAGFVTGFSFFYSAPFEPGVITVYSGVGMTGDVLAMLALPVTESDGGDPNGNFSPFFPIGVSFEGVAKSVDFGGAKNAIGFDDITLGTDDPEVGCAGVPNPFGVDRMILFTGSEGDAWEGCSDLVRRLPLGTSAAVPVFVTRGNTPSGADTVPGVRGPEVPCQMPLNEETADPDDRIVAGGDEICGLDARIEVDRGPGTIVSFTPADPLTTMVSPATPFPTKSIRIVTVPTVGEPLAAPWFHKLGDIAIDAGNDTSLDNGQTRVVAKSAVGGAMPIDDTNLYQEEGVGGMPASLVAEGLLNTVLFIPEPSVWLQLPSALLGLALLARLRAARLRRRRDR